MAKNIAVVSGRFVRDPEVRYANTSQACIARFTVAVDRGKDRDGSDRGADFIPVVAFRKTAEAIEKYCRKGMRVTVFGSIQTGQYKRKDASTAYTWEIAADSVDFELPKLAEDRQSSKTYQGAPSAADVTGSDDWGLQQRIEGFEQADDIPF